MKKLCLLFACLCSLLLLCACRSTHNITLPVAETTPIASDSFAESEKSDLPSDTGLKPDTVESGTASSGLPKPAETTGQSVEGTTAAAAFPPQNAENSVEPSVTLSVSCANAVAYGIRDIMSYAQIIPADGNILPAQSVVIEEGETAFSVLKRTLKEKKIPYSATSGGYIKSIGGLAEFDCGTNSGWLYRVNGKLPGVSSKSYKLSSGDILEFVYTCNQGDVN